jgi:hypothetical protein
MFFAVCGGTTAMATSGFITSFRKEILNCPEVIAFQVEYHFPIPVEFGILFYPVLFVIWMIVP